ncbi:MAG: hypothetical protein RLZZ182_544 [Pseudomonadota bacterium]|jgi:hypothetical protein
MRFEHLIEINSPAAHLQGVIDTFSREQLWRGLMLKVMAPERFDNGPDRVECDSTVPDQVRRTLHFGAHVLRDAVQLVSGQSIQFTPEAHGELAPIRLTVSIEEPQAGQMVLRFVYEALAEQSAEEASFNSYRHSAWLHADRDMVRQLREWLEAGELPRDVN